MQDLNLLKRGNGLKNSRLSEYDALALGLIFLWVLSFPLYGPLGYLVLGDQAWLVGQIFSLSHGLGLIALGILEVAPSRNRINLLCGLVILAFTILVSFIDHQVWLAFSALVMGWAAAFLVLSFVPRLVGGRDTVLTLGLAMALANLGLSLAQTFQGISVLEGRILLALLGTMPFLAAVLMGEEPEAKGEPLGLKGQTGFYYFVFMGSCAYLCGGVWYRILGPVFFSHFAYLAGIDSLVYAVWVISLGLYFNHRKIEDMGALAVCLLGMSFCLVLAFRKQTEVFLGSILLINMGLASLDLFYWSVLSRFAEKIKVRAVFGVGLGTSLLSLSAGGMLLERSAGGSEPDFIRGMASIGLLLLLVVIILFARFRPDKDKREEEEMLPDLVKDAKEIGEERELDLTPSERRVYDLLVQGYSDVRIAEELLISRNTVKFHVRNILRKAGVANRKELLAMRLKRDTE